MNRQQSRGNPESTNVRLDFSQSSNCLIGPQLQIFPFVQFVVTHSFLTLPLEKSTRIFEVFLSSTSYGQNHAQFVNWTHLKNCNPEATIFLMIWTHLETVIEKGTISPQVLQLHIRSLEQKTPPLSTSDRIRQLGIRRYHIGSADTEPLHQYL